MRLLARSITASAADGSPGRCSDVPSRSAGHLESQLRTNDAEPALGASKPHSNGRRVLRDDSDDVVSTVAVEVVDQERDHLTAGRKLGRRADRITVERPHVNRALDDREQLVARITHDIAYRKAVAPGAEIAYAMTSRGLEGAGRRLPDERDRRRHACVDEIGKPVVVEVVRGDGRDPVAHGHRGPAEAPVLREVVDASRKETPRRPASHRIAGGRSRSGS